MKPTGNGPERFSLVFSRPLRLSLLVIPLFTLAIGFVGCAPPEPTPEISEPDWLAVNDFLYQLQHARPDRIGETAYDLLVVSISAAGNSREAIENLKHSPGGDKIVLCYMSIGQAEDYRFYWQREWYQDPPTWLDEPDPDWAGDYWVRYWDPEWQAIIYGSPDSYLDRILDLGFDGVYLDRVDTYYYYEERGRETAAREMADFIIGLTEYARERHPGFGVFPQNAEELGIRFPDYLDTVTGIGVEDLYYGYPRDHTASPPEWTAEREKILDEWVVAGKLVLTIDYTRIPEQIDDAYARSQARSYVPFVTVRSLGQIIINEGHEPD
jgi:cysteinyl-tRNA synthetase